MTAGWLERTDTSLTEAGRVSILVELADDIRDRAIAVARARVSASQGRVDLPELLQRPDFALHFLHGLASGVAHVLGANDRRVLAVYASEFVPAADLLAPPCGALAHLFVLVMVPSAALDALVSSLNRGLGASLSALPAPLSGRTEPPLDISLVTEQDVRQGMGVARLLSAVRPPPVKLWERSL